MSYSKDLKERVLTYVRKGGSKQEAARLFNIARSTVYTWLSEPDDHCPGVPGPKNNRKFKREELLQRVKEKPDSLQKELAAYFKVSVNAISRALKRLGIVRKKRLYAIGKARRVKGGDGVI
jgi:transposase